MVAVIIIATLCYVLVLALLICLIRRLVRSSRHAIRWHAIAHAHTFAPIVYLFADSIRFSYRYGSGQTWTIRCATQHCYYHYYVIHCSESSSRHVEVTITGHRRRRKKAITKRQFNGITARDILDWVRRCMNWPSLCWKYPFIDLIDFICHFHSPREIVRHSTVFMPRHSISDTKLPTDMHDGRREYFSISIQAF